MAAAVPIPEPVAVDFRFAWRVDYFKTAEEAVRFAEYQRAQGYNVSEPWEPCDYRHHSGSTVHRDVHGVHWSDRPGEGWYQ